MAADGVPESSPGWTCPGENAPATPARDAVFDGEPETWAEKFRAHVAMSKAAAEDPTSRVALDTTLTPERLAVLASHADLWVRVGVAHNPRSSAETLRLLARDEEVLVRSHVGSRLCGKGWDPRFPVVHVMDMDVTWIGICLLAEIQSDPDRASRAERGLADILVTLASDPEPVVRRSVWMHPDLPERFLRVAAGDPNDDERAQAAVSPVMPFDLLRHLAADPCWQVRAAVGANKRSPTSVLTELARDPCWQVRAAVGANRSTPVSVLTQLASDRDSEARRAVAGNRTSSLETLQNLTGDPWVGVRSSAMANLRLWHVGPQGSE